MAANSIFAGNVLRFSGYGKASNDSPSDDLTIRIKVNGVTKVTLTNSARTFSDDGLHLEGVATQRTVGASGQRAMHFDLCIGSDCSTINQVGTIDTTANMDVTITAQWNVAKAGNTISLYEAFMEYKN